MNKLEEFEQYIEEKVFTSMMVDAVATYGDDCINYYFTTEQYALQLAKAGKLVVIADTLVKVGSYREVKLYEPTKRSFK